MNRGFSISIFLLFDVLWKDLNPGCKITTLAMDMCLLESICPLNKQPKLDCFERVLGYPPLHCCIFGFFGVFLICLWKLGMMQQFLFSCHDCIAVILNLLGRVTSLIAMRGISGYITTLPA